MVGFTCIKTGRDATFFQHGGLWHLPTAYLWIAMASLPAGMIHLNALKRWGTRRSRTGLLILTSLLFLSFSPFIQPEQQTAVYILFILTPVVFAGVFASAWLLAGDLLEEAGAEERRWVYSRIGAGSMVGGILGGGLASVLSPAFSPGLLVALGSLFLLAVAWLVFRAHRTNPVPAGKAVAEDPATHRQEDSDGALIQNGGLLSQPYVAGLLGVSALAALAALFIDFQFYAAVTLTGYNTADFFGGFYALLNLAALVLQLAVTPKLQAKLGVGRSLTVLPLALLGGVGLAIYSSSLLARSIPKLTESGVKASIHRSAWEQVFLPISPRYRDTAKMVVDGLSSRLAEGLGAAVLYFWLWRGSRNEADLNLSWISGAIVLVIAGWITLIVYLNRRGCSEVQFEDSMLRLPDS